MEISPHLSSYTAIWRRGEYYFSAGFAFRLCVLFFIISACLCDTHAKVVTINSKITTEVLLPSGKIDRTEEKSGAYMSGARVNSDGPIRGHLVHVHTKVNKSDQGCGPLDPGIVPSKPWIALVQRGNCSFNEKIYYSAKLSNATAVIIFNYKDDQQKVSVEDPSVQFDAKNEKEILKFDVHDVSAIFVTHSKGQMLLDLLRKFNNVNVTINCIGTSNEKPITTGAQLNHTSVLFVSISFIVLIIISLAWLVFYYIQRCRYSNAKERLSRRLLNAAKKAIAKIPQRSVRIGDKELDSDADQCAVCIEPYKIYDVIRVLPCKHVFHKSCVDPWLLDQRSCPMCKMDILRAFGMLLNDSQESVPQDVDSALMSSTQAADDSELPLSHEEEQGAMGGVKIVLYRDNIRYSRDGSSHSRGYTEPDYSSDCDGHSSPVAQCHVECTSHALVEQHRPASTDSDSDHILLAATGPHSPTLTPRSECHISLHSQFSDDDDHNLGYESRELREAEENRSLINRWHEPSSDYVIAGTKSRDTSSESDSIGVLSIKD